MRRVVIAGIGNVFLGDDGFGVEVARRLVGTALPDGVEVLDVGIRGLGLAYTLADGFDLLVAVDAVPRGGAPGTLYVVEADTSVDAAQPDAHSLSLPSVFMLVRALGGTLGRVLVVGCEPADTGERLGLSPAVADAVDEAVRRVRALVSEGGGAVDVLTQAQ